MLVHDNMRTHLHCHVNEHGIRRDRTCLHSCSRDTLSHAALSSGKEEGSIEPELRSKTSDVTSEIVMPDNIALTRLSIGGGHISPLFSLHRMSIMQMSNILQSCHASNMYPNICSPCTHLANNHTHQTFAFLPI